MKCNSGGAIPFWGGRFIFESSTRQHAVAPPKSRRFKFASRWETRGIRTAIVEIQNFLLDIVLHPASL